MCRCPSSSTTGCRRIPADARNSLVAILDADGVRDGAFALSRSSSPCPPSSDPCGVLVPYAQIIRPSSTTVATATVISGTIATATATNPAAGILASPCPRHAGFALRASEICCRGPSLPRQRLLLLVQLEPLLLLLAIAVRRSLVRVARPPQ